MEQYKFIEDLLWCPSQIYYYFTSNNKKFCIYLRWRYKDPWRAYLVECEEDWDFSKDWNKLSLSRDYKDEEYKELEEEVLNKVSSMFPNIEFSNESDDVTLKLVDEDIDISNLSTSTP